MSAFFLVRDEGATLERALDSIAELDAEIVIGVDVASRDTTRSIAERRAHRVIDVDFEGALACDFSAARNLLDSAASGTWGFTLDGHEHLAPGHAR